MRVTSVPGRLTSASPSGIEKPGSVGTSPFWPCSRMVSMKRHGSSSKIAEVSRPLPSRGVDGTITFSPGTCMNHASSDCECVAPVASPPYTWVRTVIGAVVRPAVMNRIFAALLISWSAAMPMKSMIMISATGSMPSIAAPMAAPTIAASEIGVSSTRSWPYLVDSPAVGPDAPGSAMSSPSRNTRSSDASAWSSARFSASRIVISCLVHRLPLLRRGTRSGWRTRRARARRRSAHRRPSPSCSADSTSARAPSSMPVSSSSVHTPVSTSCLRKRGTGSAAFAASSCSSGMYSIRSPK